jgi:four helix bundle protein
MSPGVLSKRYMHIYYANFEEDNMSMHKELDAWKFSMELVKFTYTATNSFPREERYGLTSQVRRSVVSVASNIAEGAARNSDREFLHFLYVALGSLAEVETQFLIAADLDFFTDNSVLLKIEKARKPILGLIKHLRQKSA